jgi:hypothetical protein
MSSAAVLMGVLVVLVVILVVLAATGSKWGRAEYWKAQFVEGPGEVAARSSHGGDEAARIAVNHAENRIEVAEAAGRGAGEDHHRAAALIETALRDPPPPAEARDFTAAARVPAAEREDPRAARRALFNRARQHYILALRDYEPRDQRRDRYLPGNIVENAINFALLEGWDVFLVGGPEEPNIAPPGARQPRRQPDRPVDTALLRAAEARRERDIAERRARVDAEVGQAGAAVRAGAMLDLAESRTNDPQNAHDPGVNAAKRGIVARLRAEQPALHELPPVAAVVEFFRAHAEALSRDPRTGRPRPRLVESAVGTAERMARSGYVMSADATADEVLRRVWARADDPANAESADALRQALFDALVDCWQPGIAGDALVCPDGQVSRAIGALALNDHDPRNWTLARQEELKNSILEAARRLMLEEARAAAESPDMKLRVVGRRALAVTVEELAAAGEADAAVEAQWSENTAKKLEALVEELAASINSTNAGALPRPIIDGLKAEVAAAVY